MPIESVHRWHVRVWGTSPTLVRKSLQHCGFSIDVMPEAAHTRMQFTVCHAHASAVTVWLLKHAQIAQHVTVIDI